MLLIPAPVRGATALDALVMDTDADRSDVATITPAQGCSVAGVVA